ncbi:MAG: bifunctional riboflavin kinase/FAD synthetase [Candidatus Binatus sp.]|jgi:riboflavin kinase/FMN adenylyltransferase|uniref:bifunctional riboflavin kinase/FAD synthetase n=1 Tax=Candidatus Binatus sp. TaxID=2811406 RepID=UPI003C97FEF6
MEIIRDLAALARHSYPVTAIGNFDGVHLGHRAILKAAIDHARAAGGTAFALTFDPLPAKVLAPARAPRLILTPDDKLEMLRLSGTDGVIVLDFTRELSRLSPRDFVRDYLRAKIGVREVVVGHSVSFGHNRAGNAAMMVELGREFGFDTEVVGPIKIDGLEVSSTKVREAIAAGDLRGAARLLGRYHFLRGPVVRGRERGRTIGFPTANLASETECIPPDGVYATRVILDDGAYPAITNIGMRPTFSETERSIEAHIFDFTRDLYGTRIKLELVERIRAERKFDSADALKAQIALDLSKVREILSAA